MNGPNQEQLSRDNLLFLGHVETLIRDRVCAAIKQHETENQHVLAGYERDISDLVTRCDHLEKLLRSGFPNGDPVGHCSVHQGYINEAADRRTRISTTISNVTNAGLIGAGVLVINAIWDYFKNHLK